jgi:outer membrane receptor for ferrienterochelin and colicin
MQLVTLIPGAVILDEDQLALTTSLSISQASVNGNRPNYNSLSVDGGFNMDSGSNNSQVNNVGIDFVQEVKIAASNFSAEYGRNAGAAINIVTRGGGNTFHGSVFEFLRNDTLDARNFFSPVKAKLRFNNFGWNFNGPIKKDKLFFFVGQEYKRIRQDTAPVKRSLPTRAERLGDFSARTGTLNVPTGYTAINPATGVTVAAGQPARRDGAAVVDLLEHVGERHAAHAVDGAGPYG